MTTPAPHNPPETPAPRRRRWPAVLLLVAFASAGAYLHFMHRGLAEEWKDRLLVWTAGHPRLTPLLLAGVYFACGLLMLPVWWVQLLAGACFGLVGGTLYCTALAGITAGVQTTISRSLARAWFDRKIEARLGKLHDLAARLGSGGLRTVLVVRLTHVIPFGLSNYAFGLLGLRRRDVVLGTLFGSLPTIAFYAAIGSGRLTNDWRTIAALAGVNAVMLIGLWLTRPRRR